MAGFNARRLDCFMKMLMICILCSPSPTKGQYYLPTVFWDPESPALHPDYWSKVVNVDIFQALTFLCPNNDINIVPYSASNTRSYYNLYVREVSPNDTDLDYSTVCDPQKSKYLFSCNQTRNTKIDFTRPGNYRQLAININQADPRDPSFKQGMDYIFFSTSDGRQDSLITSSKKCTMVFRIHFCQSNEPCARPLCATYGREEVCVAKSGLSDVPRNLTVTANTTSSLSISWKQPLNTNNAVAYYAICYRANTSQACQTKMTEGHVLSAILDNLNSSTQYFIRVRAFSCKGPGRYSAEISYKTQELPAPSTTEPPKTTPATTRIITTEKNDVIITAPPKKLKLTTKTSSTVTIAWQAPDTGDVLYYSLCARVGGIPGRECITTLVKPTQLSAVIYGLKANPLYGIRVRAENSQRPGNYSKELMVRTDGVPLLFKYFVLNVGACRTSDMVTTENYIVKTWEVEKSCLDHYKAGKRHNDMYRINPDGKGSFSVMCEMTGGGWTLFQHRYDGYLDFYRKWQDYKKGFGSLLGEFWLGLEKIHRITSSRKMKLRIDLEDFAGNKVYAEYTPFRVGNGHSGYRLHIGKYSGTAGDSLSYHNGMAFSTKDADHDHSYWGNCAQSFHGAWWYRNCHHSNLNGLYYKGGNHKSYADGIIWYHWKGYYYSMKTVTMKMKEI